MFASLQGGIRSLWARLVKGGFTEMELELILEEWGRIIQVKKKIDGIPEKGNNMRMVLMPLSLPWLCPINYFGLSNLKFGSVKQPFYNVHGFSGSGIWTGHSWDTLPLSHHVWDLSWEDSKAGSNLAGKAWNHLDMASLTCGAANATCHLGCQLSCTWPLHVGWSGLP